MSFLLHQTTTFSALSSLPVANPPAMVSAEQVSPGTSIRVTWSPPSGGATVTGYRVHYSSDGDEGYVHRNSSDTTADIENLMNDGRTYTISVEAQSQHLSGESNTMNVPLCELSAVLIYIGCASSVSGACPCPLPQWLQTPLVLQLVSV